jgi:hypothetical protein
VVGVSRASVADQAIHNSRIPRYLGAAQRNSTYAQLLTVSSLTVTTAEKPTASQKQTRPSKCLDEAA